MTQRIRRPLSWYEIKATLWYLPALYTVAAVLLATLMVQLDRSLAAEGHFRHWWGFSGGADGARGVLSTIGGTTMTVATTAFSFTIVALQLGSSQFSPRLLRRFTGDRGNQTVLGIFIGTFVYCLLVLRVIRSADEGAGEFVPSVSVTVALLLAGISIAALIYFFHHSTRTIQVSVVIERAAQDIRQLIQSEKTIHTRESTHQRPDAALDAQIGPAVIEVRSPYAGYVHDVDADALERIATEAGIIIRVLPRIGDYVLSRAVIFTLHGPVAEDPWDTRLLALIEIGIERTMERDVLLGFQQIADIALKALSPAVNDPTTAMMCIDRLGEALVQVDPISCHELVYVDDAGKPRVIATHPGFARFLRVAMVQIRHYGASDPMVASHLLRVLRAVAEGVRPESSEVTRDMARTVREAALRSLALASDREMIEQEAAWISDPGSDDPARDRIIPLQ